MIDKEQTPSVKVDLLKELLKEKTGFARLIHNKEIMTLCPFCEEKRFHSRASHGHMYLNIYDLRSNCFRCDDGKGTLLKVLKKLGVNPVDYITDKDIFQNWSKFIKTRRLNEKFESKEYKFEEQENISKEKLLYLKGRLGADIDVEKIPGLIVSTDKFIEENDIELSEEDKMNIEYLSKNFIGFVGTRGSIIVFRNIYESDEKRYSKINLHDDYFFKDFYGIKTNYIKETSNTIILCEGIFDLLVGLKSKELFSVFKESCFCAACLGNSYKKTILSVLDYCKLPKANFIILSDKDVKINDFRKWVFNFPFIGNLHVCWNKVGKDFGKLPIEPIIEQIKVGDRRYARRTSYATNSKNICKNSFSW